MMRFNRNLIAVVHDAVMAGISFLLSLYLRLGDDLMYTVQDVKPQATLLFTLVSVGVFYYMRLYRGLWRYASMRDLAAIIKAVTLAILVFAVAMFVFNRLEALPRSVFFINWMLLLVLLAGPRFIYRALHEGTVSWRQAPAETVKIPVLLVGANDHAERFIRDMSRDIRALFDPVAIVDDDVKRKGRTIHDVPIYCGTDALAHVVAKLERKGKRPQKLIVTDAQASPELMRRLLAESDPLGIPLARLPKTHEFKTGLHDRLDIQPIAIEDLLGRAQNVRDRTPMRELVEGRKVLVTGAGGTIGGELTRQIASYQPSGLVLFELSEFNLYQIERQLIDLFPELPLVAVVGDVRDREHVEQVFSDHKPQLVFHAAAIKHVPIAENNAEETLLTNVFGTKNLAEACVRHRASGMVMISTDKAVNPTNVMGASKRLAESICQALASEHAFTRFVTVRFGNVLGSAGSVVPLFQDQLAKGGPLTVTHPEMTRYFMTVREAVELVLQAAALGAVTMQRAESIFVLDMGEPVRIKDLAEQMIRLAGLKPHEDIKIIYIGLRKGEKMHEELFYASEQAVKTAYEGIFLASPRQCDISLLRKGLEQLMTACIQRREKEARGLLKELVPEFEPSHHAKAS